MIAKKGGRLEKTKTSPWGREEYGIERDEYLAYSSKNGTILSLTNIGKAMGREIATRCVEKRIQGRQR